eukprot:9204346-Pyramimonas_sp.AAC.1
MNASGRQPQTLVAAPDQGAAPPSLARSPGGREVDNGEGREVNIRQGPPQMTPVNPATPSGGFARTRAPVDETRPSPGSADNPAPTDTSAEIAGVSGAGTAGSPENHTGAGAPRGEQTSPTDTHANSEQPTTGNGGAATPASTRDAQ